MKWDWTLAGVPSTLQSDHLFFLQKQSPLGFFGNEGPTAATFCRCCATVWRKLPSLFACLATWDEEGRPRTLHKYLSLNNPCGDICPSADWERLSARFSQSHQDFSVHRFWRFLKSIISRWWSGRSCWETRGRFLFSIFVLRTSHHCSSPSPPVREAKPLLSPTSSGFFFWFCFLQPQSVPSWT